MRKNRPLNQVRVGLVAEQKVCLLAEHAAADGGQESHGSGYVCRKGMCDRAGHPRSGNGW